MFTYSTIPRTQISDKRQGRHRPAHFRTTTQSLAIILVLLSSSSILANDSAQKPAIHGTDLPVNAAVDVGSLFPPINRISAELPAASVRPEDAAAPFFAAAGTQSHEQHSVPVSNVYRAPVLCIPHKPLYFEDPHLERCGRSYGCAQPTISAVRLIGQLATWPYQIGAQPPWIVINTPDTCPTLQPETQTRNHGLWPALVEGGAVTGLIFLIP